MASLHRSQGHLDLTHQLFYAYKISGFNNACTLDLLGCITGKNKEIFVSFNSQTCQSIFFVRFLEGASYPLPSQAFFGTLSKGVGARLTTTSRVNTGGIINFLRFKKSLRFGDHTKCYQKKGSEGKRPRIVAGPAFPRRRCDNKSAGI